ncbi:MAG: DUF2905 domain-containing protein [Candidatus Hydrogenedentes bacterium]|nr:DUF2905 domain-containing protein [Candidatus Hydrogenedentota bacterium]
MAVVGGVFFGWSWGVVATCSVFGLIIGRLPGDIVVKGERVSVCFPVVTCLVLSVVA